MDNSDGFHVRESSGKTPDGGRFVSYTVWYTSDDAPRPQRDTNTSIPEDDTTRFDENASFDEDGRPRRKRRLTGGRVESALWIVVAVGFVVFIFPDRFGYLAVGPLGFAGQMVYRTFMALAFALMVMELLRGWTPLRSANRRSQAIVAIVAGCLVLPALLGNFVRDLPYLSHPVEREYTQCMAIKTASGGRYGNTSRLVCDQGARYEIGPGVMSDVDDKAGRPHRAVSYKVAYLPHTKHVMSVTVLDHPTWGDDLRSHAG